MYVLKVSNVLEMNIIRGISKHPCCDNRVLNGFKHNGYSFYMHPLIIFMASLSAQFNVIDNEKIFLRKKKFFY